MDDLAILYQDADVIAVHKPHGLLVHRSRIDPHAKENAVTLLRRQLGQQVYPVHRLDKPTAGVLLFARDAESARQLQAQFVEGCVQKTYVAIVRGWVLEKGRIDYPLRKVVDRTMGRYAGTAERQEAITHYQPLARIEVPYAVDRYPTARYSLVQLTPETGRQHQLRRHLKHISHPIIGDKKYGKATHNRFFVAHFGVETLCLAATELTFMQPTTKQPLTIVGPLVHGLRHIITVLSWQESVPPEWLSAGSSP